MSETSMGLDIVNPSSLVIACLSGYRASSSMLNDPDFIKELNRQADLVGISHAEAFTLIQAEVEMYEVASSGPTGMENLRDFLIKNLNARGVIATNVMHGQWSEKADDKFGSPNYTTLMQDVRSRHPSHIVIIGHSYGAWTACRMSRELHPRPAFVGLIDAMFSYCFFGCRRFQSGEQKDARDYPVGDSFFNWWQDKETPLGLRNIKFELNGQKSVMPGTRVANVNHTTIDDSAIIHSEILNRIITLLS